LIQIKRRAYSPGFSTHAILQNVIDTMLSQDSMVFNGSKLSRRASTPGQEPMPLLTETLDPAADGMRQAIRDAYLTDEAGIIECLLPLAALDPQQAQTTTVTALTLIEAVRTTDTHIVDIESFLREFKLSTQEGMLLMCLAEALLRLPDEATAERLIQDTLSQGDWSRHLGRSDSLFTNAGTWALVLTGRFMDWQGDRGEGVFADLKKLLAKSGTPAVRLAITQAIRILAQRFVMGRNIAEALERSRPAENAGYCHSFDMLGEAAMTEAAALAYFEAYREAIAALAGTANSVSVKFSALHPRYESTQRERVLAELPPRLLDLARAALRANIGLTVDAEESERLDMSVDVFERVYRHPDLLDYHGLGLAVQAYQKRALPLIDWLAQLARSLGKRMPLRLVKGAYWDTEIKRAQVQGLAGYPVYTRKTATDVSYLACAQRLLAARDAFLPQFATHNAYTVAAILALSGGHRDFEFQRLYGMGEALYDKVLADASLAAPCRVYAPVGGHEALLPYLVRRLLENGANASFVHSVADPAIAVGQLVADPVAALRALEVKPHPRIVLPQDIYGSERRNSQGFSFADANAVAPLLGQMRLTLGRPYEATALIDGLPCSGAQREIRSPADGECLVGHVTEADEGALQRALAGATAAAAPWAATPAVQRAECLDRAADLIEAERATLMALLAREGGKSLPDGLAEVREAADYCRYYAALVRRDFATPRTLQGPTGELNQFALHGRGLFAAISPWNFPLAIFVGQIAAALAAGNAVIAKPSRQTPLVGFHAVRLLHRAGIPASVLHYAPGPGAALGGRLAGDERVKGVVFTGSTGTAQSINRLLAARHGAIVPFIAETGGQNVMIADSSALPEHVVSDVLQSAFNSAGQRCSALRVLFVQEEIAERLLPLLCGAMQELVIGDPMNLATDVGPVIDAAAQLELLQHIEKMRRLAKPLCELRLPADTAKGTFVAPCAFEIPGLDMLEGEVFGPVLHVIRYQRSALDKVIDAINGTGYGLTLGIASRIESTIRQIQSRARVGNIYVNRNMIGAVVGVQPFGGEGLSGTGPKAGGPNYLLRFATERTVSVNTAAIGGNTGLSALE
jgi:RHH-type transcriptional regulator, proline utilization regulon repressor / proline dehydrogenase / delta 1-pyrroline-5-carboxylate dehydrogenase